MDSPGPPLRRHHVRPLLRDEQSAGLAQEERDLVRHRRGREEERLLLAEQLGRPALKLVDRRILAQLLVADLGGGHRGAHPRRRLLAVSERRSITGLCYRSRVDVDLLERTLAERGEPAYRARQVWDWAARGALRLRRDDERARPRCARSSPSACRSRRSTVETEAHVAATAR